MPARAARSRSPQDDGSGGCAAAQDPDAGAAAAAAVGPPAAQQITDRWEKQRQRQQGGPALDNLSDELLLTVCSSGVTSLDLSRLQCVALSFWEFRGELTDGRTATLGECASQRLITSRGDVWRVQPLVNETWIQVLCALEQLQPLQPIASGGAHTLVVVGPGRLISFGSNQSYQLGLGAPNLDDGREVGDEDFFDDENRDKAIEFTPQAVESLGEEHIVVSVAASASHSLCLSKDGHPPDAHVGLEPRRSARNRRQSRR